MGVDVLSLCQGGSEGTLDTARTGVTDNSSQDNSSRTIRRGQFVVNYNINFIRYL